MVDILSIYDQIRSGARPAIITYELAEAVDVDGNEYTQKYSFVIDCTLNLTHSNNATITSHPIEDGETINDHAILQPRTLSLAGIISDTPYVLYNFDFPFSTQDKASKKAYDIFQEIFKSKTLVTIETDLEKYEDMYIESMTFPRSKDTQKSLEFTLNMKQVTFVVSDFTDLPDNKLKQDVRSKATGLKSADTNLQEKTANNSEDPSSIGWDLFYGK